LGIVLFSVLSGLGRLTSFLADSEGFCCSSMSWVVRGVGLCGFLKRWTLFRLVC
jgi:hypothetical protein